MQIEIFAMQPFNADRIDIQIEVRGFISGLDIAMQKGDPESMKKLISDKTEELLRTLKQKGVYPELEGGS